MYEHIKQPLLPKEKFYLRMVRSCLLALAVLVASSRVVLGSHYPSDVLAGAALATAFTLRMVKVFAAKRLVFAVAADGSITPKAGPSMRRILALFSSSHRDLGLEEARS